MLLACIEKETVTMSTQKQENTYQRLVTRSSKRIKMPVAINNIREVRKLC